MDAKDAREDDEIVERKIQELSDRLSRVLDGHNHFECLLALMSIIHEIYEEKESEDARASIRNLVSFALSYTEEQ